MYVILKTLLQLALNIDRSVRSLLKDSIVWRLPWKINSFRSSESFLNSWRLIAVLKMLAFVSALDQLIKSTPLYLTSPRSILILCSHLPLGLRIGVVPWGCASNNTPAGTCLFRHTCQMSRHDTAPRRYTPKTPCYVTYGNVCFKSARHSDRS